MPGQNFENVRSVRLLSAIVICCSAQLVPESGAHAQGGPPPQLVRVDAVRQEVVEQRREVTGEVRAVKQSTVATEEAGLVLALAVDVGDRVEEGQLLAQLDDHLLKLELEQRHALTESKRAEVLEEQAKQEKAARDLRRLEELASRAGASQNEVDDAKTALAEADARLARVQAELANAEAEEKWSARRVSYMQVRAPFAGAIVRKGTEVGQWVRAGDSVVELVSLDEVDVYLDVPERFIEALTSAGAKVELRLPALRETLQAGNFTVISLGDRLARTFPVRVRLPNPDGRLRPGMSAIGMTPTGSPVEGMTVHKDSIMRNDAGSFVWFDGAGSARVAPVDVMFASGDRVVVRSPVLKPGMNVLVEGNERVFPGQPLKYLDGAPSESTDAAQTEAH